MPLITGKRSDALNAQVCINLKGWRWLWPKRQQGNSVSCAYQTQRSCSHGNVMCRISFTSARYRDVVCYEYNSGQPISNYSYDNMIRYIMSTCAMPAVEKIPETTVVPLFHHSVFSQKGKRKPSDCHFWKRFELFNSVRQSKNKRCHIVSADLFLCRAVKGCDDAGGGGSLRVERHRGPSERLYSGRFPFLGLRGNTSGQKPQLITG